MSVMVQRTALCAAFAAVAMFASGCGSDDLEFDEPTDGPEKLFQGDCEPAALEGWDPSAPWPLLSAAIFDGSYVLANGKVTDEGGKHECSRFGDVWVWGWKPERQGPEKVYDGPPSEGALSKLKEFTLNKPWPVLAMFHQDGAWHTAEFFKVLAEGTIEVKASADRIVVWEFKILPPQVFWRGPRTKLNIPWKTEAPRPMLPFAVQPDVHIEYDPLFILKSDGRYPSALEDEEIVWGW